ncbi:hypothetical protein FQA39_LY01644 [Lamprigera yunnana]|nr:hypothetical protein FQA39_LY01644 [Lamprigera yunnana]
MTVITTSLNKKCSKCGLLYHPSCAKRAKINADGWVSFCCYSTAADEVNEVNDLDENSRVLFKLIEAKFNGLEVKFNGLDSKIDNTLITVKEKLCKLDDRVLKLEDNNVYLLENVISEINKRNSKECNCIIYKLEDSENAVKKDIELFKNLLACCNDEPSFNINDIKLIRLGKKFKSGVDRPLKVVFPNKDCLHWFFHNKKMIIEKSKKSIIITGDLTNAQRDFRNKTVLESPSGGSHDEENDIWSQTYMLPGEADNTALKRWGQKQAWCKPSCIPISIILVLIFLVVLLPLLDHAMERTDSHVIPLLSGTHLDTCSMSLVESIPEGLVYSDNATIFPSTYHTWLDLINSSRETIEIASFYWTLRTSEVYPHPSSSQGEDVFQALLNVGLTKGVKIKIAQNIPTQSNPNTDTEYLVKRKAAEVRDLNFPQLLGSNGVLHTKLWIIDRTHAYIGSANMDWRSLTQVKELGIVVRNCSSLSEDIAKIFDVYWMLGIPGAKVPNRWPSFLETHYNVNTPMNLILNNETFQTYISSSPPPLSPAGRTNDLEALLNTIKKAEKFVYISVMDYFPLTIFTPKIKFWASIDNALRTAAINKITVRLLISKWNHTRQSEYYFLKSLADINNSYSYIKIEVKLFIVPATEDQANIPFARVNHNKYMVTDNTVYIGTSNWSGDYFIDTAGIGAIIHDPMYNRNDTHVTIRRQLQAIFERDWNSQYAFPLV